MQAVLRIWTVHDKGQVRSENHVLVPCRSDTDHPLCTCGCSCCCCCCSLPVLMTLTMGLVSGDRGCSSKIITNNPTTPLASAMAFLVFEPRYNFIHTHNLQFVLFAFFCSLLRFNLSILNRICIQSQRNISKAVT